MIDLIASRAPLGFAEIASVATKAELAEVIHGYARLAGFAATPGLPVAEGAAQARP